jgi:hypothetical protein
MGAKKKDRRLDVFFKGIEKKQIEDVQDLTMDVLKKKSTPKLRLQK